MVPECDPGELLVDWTSFWEKCIAHVKKIEERERQALDKAMEIAINSDVTFVLEDFQEEGGAAGCDLEELLDRALQKKICTSDELQKLKVLCGRL